MECYKPLGSREIHASVPQGRELAVMKTGGRFASKVEGVSRGAVGNECRVNRSLLHSFLFASVWMKGYIISPVAC